MGYGHQRTAYALKSLALDGKIINANDYDGIPVRDRSIWEGMRYFYEFASDSKSIPVVGNAIFSLVDFFQRIADFYPIRDLSSPNFQLKRLFAFMRKGWGKDLIARAEQGKAPFVSTFLTPAFMAEYFDYPGDIYCVICDADIARTWVPLKPQESRIKYFAPNVRTAERLTCYGVKEANIFLTGYPLPPEIIGKETMDILKEDLKKRLVVLDPQKKYLDRYRILVEHELGTIPEEPDRPLTIMFSVGGAGAQTEIAKKIVKSLIAEIKSGQLKMILSAGVKKHVKDFFEKELLHKSDLGITGDGIEILYQANIEKYFWDFNQKLKKTDILWTKPSELSFYSALGIPIIIAPTIGSQEEFNMRWLVKSGFGIYQEDPAYTKQWLFDWLNKGYLAEAAMQGFIEGEQLGTYNIGKIISHMPVPNLTPWESASCDIEPL